MEVENYGTFYAPLTEAIARHLNKAVSRFGKINLISKISLLGKVKGQSMAWFQTEDSIQGSKQSRHL